MPQVAQASRPSQSPSACRLTAATHSQRVREAYIALYEEFGRWTPSEAFRDTFRASVVEELRRRLEAKPRVSVLEVGCGHGTWALEICDQLPRVGEKVEYLGIDFTEPRIELARQRLAGHPWARFMPADCERFQPERPFDLILGIEVISHVERHKYRDWLSRWFGWLAPGGSVIIIDKDRFTKHAMRLSWDVFKRRWLPRSLTARPYYFPEHFGDYAETIYYPSFASLRRMATRIGYAARPLFEHRFFRALFLDKPG
jgi:2-polyprenyl-3-methyl-5-hydroxy-6-metoxy-1,4-benzoquinol methylase